MGTTILIVAGLRDQNELRASGWLPVPRLEVRAYHDARMAEVIGAENARRFRGIYP